MSGCIPTFNRGFIAHPRSYLVCRMAWQSICGHLAVSYASFLLVSIHLCSSSLFEFFAGFPIFPGESEVEQIACMMELLGPPPASMLDVATRKKVFFGDAHVDLLILFHVSH